MTITSIGYDKNGTVISSWIQTIQVVLLGISYIKDVGLRIYGIESMGGRVLNKSTVFKIKGKCLNNKSFPEITGQEI